MFDLRHPREFIAISVSASEMSQWVEALAVVVLSPTPEPTKEGENQLLIVVL